MARQSWPCIFKNMRKLPLFIAPLLIALTACSPFTAPQEKDSSAKARLDYSNNVIVKPISDYLINEQSDRRYNKVIDRLISECTSKKGTPYTYPHTSTLDVGSREYGLWNIEYMQKYGYEFYSLGIQNTGPDDIDPAVQANITLCLQEDPGLLELQAASSEVSKQTELPGRILTTARGYAIQDSTWQETREAWWACLEQKGLTPRTGEDDWGSKQGLETSNQEEKVRVGLLEAQCSQETGMAQTLGDLEASYQVPLIKENQDALNQTKEALDAYSAKIQEIDQKYQ